MGARGCDPLPPPLVRIHRTRRRHRASRGEFQPAGDSAGGAGGSVATGGAAAASVAAGSVAAVGAGGGWVAAGCAEGTGSTGEAEMTGPVTAPGSYGRCPTKLPAGA